MRNLGWRQWLVVLAFVLVVSATGLFAVRTVRRAVYWQLPKHRTLDCGIVHLNKGMIAWT